MVRADGETMADALLRVQRIISVEPERPKRRESPPVEVEGVEPPAWWYDDTDDEAAQQMWVAADS